MRRAASAAREASGSRRTSREQTRPGRRGLVTSPSTAAKTGTCSGSAGSRQPSSRAAVTCVNTAASGRTSSHASRSRANSSSSLSPSRTEQEQAVAHPSEAHPAHLASDRQVLALVCVHVERSAPPGACGNHVPRDLWTGPRTDWLPGLGPADWSPTAGESALWLRLGTKPQGDAPDYGEGRAGLGGWGRLDRVGGLGLGGGRPAGGCDRRGDGRLAGDRVLQRRDLAADLVGRVRGVVGRPAPGRAWAWSRPRGPGRPA